MTSCHPLPSSDCQFSFLCPHGSLCPCSFCWSRPSFIVLVWLGLTTPGEPNVSKYTSAGSFLKEEYPVNKKALETFPHFQHQTGVHLLSSFGFPIQFWYLVLYPKGLDKETEATCSDIEWFNATSPGYCGCEWVSFSAAPVKFYPVLDNIER